MPNLIRPVANSWRCASVVILSLYGLTLPAAEPDNRPPWEAMDYGPFLTASIEAPEPRTNIAYKGIAINLGANFGGDRNEAIVFDTDLLRYSAGWTGDFVELTGVVFDGAHWAYPRIKGRQLFGNPAGPGWAKGGSFADPREHRYGPLPREWGRWGGLWLNDKQVVLSYTIGETPVLEMPALERNGDISAFVRTLNIGQAKSENIVQLAYDARRAGSLIDAESLKPTASNRPASKSIAILDLKQKPQQAAVGEQLNVQAGLLGRWDFDGSDPATAVTAGSAGKLALNEVKHTPEGQSGSGLLFEGKQLAQLENPAELEFLNQDLTISTWIKTRQDGVIFAHTGSGDKWVPDAKALFVRGGKLSCDIGWVGAVNGSTTISDGSWHHVGLTWSHAEGTITLYVDGAEDGSGRLKPRQAVKDPVFRIGFSAPDFPAAPWFRGRMDGFAIHKRALNGAEVAALAGVQSSPEVIAAALVGGVDAARWVTTGDGHLRLKLPANQTALHCKVLIWRGPTDRLPEFAALIKKSKPAGDLRELTKGGAPRWAQKLTTHGQRGSDEGPYAIDTLTDPEQNPWNSWLRFGGVDLYPDGKRAALCTWNGDVWIVSGVDGDLQNLTWQRVATGLYQPLGIQVVDEKLYVLGRDQITRLHDLNGDGEADFYENFNNDCMNGEHFHEFALDLKLGPDGNFYYIKCACHGVPAAHPHHGTLMRVSRDGSKLEVVARGFRAANGLGVGPNLEFTSIDNQGFWMPANRLNWIKPGGWYGNQWAWNPENRTNYDQPLCWMHNFVDRSGGTQLWVPGQKWGPFQDELITISYGMGHMFLVLKEEVNGLMQGAVTRLPLEFDTGVMRGVFHPENGQLYAAGLYGWAGNKTKPGGFYRIRYTGKPVNMAKELHFVQDGIVLGFTDPLDVASATDPGNYNITAWNYHWSINYGSPDLKVNGQEGRDAWPVASASLSADGRRVFLKMPDVQRIMQVHIVFNLKSATGQEVKNFVHGSIHNLGTKSGLEWLGAGAIAGATGTSTELGQEAPGLVQSFSRSGSPEVLDLRNARLPALFVASGTSPTPFVEPGPFRTRWEGFLKLDLNGHWAFEMEGRGAATLKINDEVVLEHPQEKLAGKRSKPVSLRSGLNRFELEYESPASGHAEFRLNWAAAGGLISEPIPATLFVHDRESRAFKDRELARKGRELLADLRCAQCHKPESPWKDTAMPELSAAAHSLNGVGSRLNEQWLTKWLLDPQSIRPDATMPKVLRGENAAGQAADIAAYLATLREAGKSAATADSGDKASRIAAGAKTFTDLGCAACHQVPGELALTNDTRILLGHVASKWQPAALQEFLGAPTRHFAWSRMPDFKLTREEADNLSAFLLERTGAGAAVANAPGAAKGDAARGAELVTTAGCLSCHSIDKVLDKSHAPALAQVATSDWSKGCMAEPGARGAAPEIPCTPQQRSALRSFIRPEFLPALQRDAPAEFAERQYRALRCQSCHPRDHQTDLLTQLNRLTEKPKAASDDDDFMAERTVHVGMPLLTYSGEKLYAEWMRRLLDGSLPYKPRTELKSRMPAFPAYASGLAEGLAQQHGYPAESAPARVVDAQLATLGQRLTGTAEGFSCVACHDVGKQKALAGKDTATVNFAFVADRLRPSYYWRYVQDPHKLMPGTMMPKFIGEDGTTPVKAILNGDPRQQFDAIWHYFQSLQPAVP